MHNIHRIRHRTHIIMDGDYMNKLPQRKNIRLKNYDYSQPGYYFITICTKDKKKYLGDISCGRGGALLHPPYYSLNIIFIIFPF